MQTQGNFHGDYRATSRMDMAIGLERNRTEVSLQNMIVFNQDTQTSARINNHA